MSVFGRQRTQAARPDEIREDDLSGRGAEGGILALDQPEASQTLPET